MVNSWGRRLWCFEIPRARVLKGDADIGTQMASLWCRTKEPLPVKLNGPSGV